jgi:RsiW-degrading membrane proteinase PrsW (M82 family)
MSFGFLPLAVPAFLENGRDLELIGLVLGVIFWIQMMRLCITREPPSTQKILWLVFMIVVPGLGSLIYFFARSPRVWR